MIKKPPFINNQNKVTQTDIRILCEKLLLNKKDIDFLNKIFNETEKTSTDISYIDLLTNDIKSQNGVRRRLDELVKKGALIKTKKKINNANKPCALFIISKIKLIDITMNDIISDDINNNFESMATKECFLDNVFINKKATGDLFCQILFAALTYNREDKSKERHVTIKWNRENITISARTITGENKVLARITDLRFYIAILKICENEMIRLTHENKKIENNFEIDSLRVNQFLKRESNSGNKESLISALNRLADTQFKLENWPQSILSSFSLEDGFQNINPLSDLSISTEKKGNGLYSKTIIKFSLPFYIFHSIKTNKLKILNLDPKFLNEKNPVIFSLHLYCRRIFENYETKNYGMHSLYSLKEKIAPDLSLSDFKRILFNGLEQIVAKRVESGEKIISQQEKIKNKKIKQIKLEEIQYNQQSKEKDIIGYTANIYGFYFKIRGNKYSIRINNSDKYVGLPSKFRYKKQLRLSDNSQEIIDINTQQSEIKF